MIILSQQNESRQHFFGTTFCRGRAKIYVERNLTAMAEDSFDCRLKRVLASNFANISLTDKETECIKNLYDGYDDVVASLPTC